MRLMDTLDADRTHPDANNQEADLKKKGGGDARASRFSRLLPEAEKGIIRRRAAAASTPMNARCCSASIRP